MLNKSGWTNWSHHFCFSCDYFHGGPRLKKYLMIWNRRILERTKLFPCVQNRSPSANWTAATGSTTFFKKLRLKVSMNTFLLLRPTWFIGTFLSSYWFFSLQYDINIHDKYLLVSLQVDQLYFEKVHSEMNLDKIVNLESLLPTDCYLLILIL